MTMGLQGQRDLWFINQHYVILGVIPDIRVHKFGDKANLAVSLSLT